MFLFIAHALVAQSPPILNSEAHHPDLFGASIASIGDLDGGGLLDVAIGDPAWFGQQRDRGCVWLVSSETGRALGSIDPSVASLGFGWRISNVGDVDGDGNADIAVSTADFSPQMVTGSANVSVWSCTSGFELLAISTDAVNFWCSWDTFGAGAAVCGVGDWNRDGRADLAVGSPNYSDRAPCCGRVDVISGRDGTSIQRFVGLEPLGGFGRVLCTIDDLDGDGQRELVVGSVGTAELPSNPDGFVRIFGSSDMAPLATLRSEPGTKTFGLSLAGADDLDGDGRPDLWIGDPYADFSPTPPLVSEVQAWSSRGWKRLFRVGPKVIPTNPMPRRFTVGLVGLDDIDGDGCSDVVTTNPECWGSEAFVLSACGPKLRQFSIDTPSFDSYGMGLSASDAGDLDSDGSRDFFVGGGTWRGCLIGVVSAWSARKGTRIRDITRASIQTTTGR